MDLTKTLVDVHRLRRRCDASEFMMQDDTLPGFFSIFVGNMS